MAKHALTQRSFVLGEVREGFLEADDLELRAKSVRRARNVRISDTRTLIARDGTFFVREDAGARSMTEIRPDTTAAYLVVIGDGFLRVLDQSGAVVFENLSAPWADGSSVWVEPFRADTIIGWPGGLHVLRLAETAWSFTDFAFDTAPNGEIAQPYWVFHKGVTIQPSNYSGDITVVASRGVFTAQYVGKRIRYVGKEILITAFSSPTVVSGTIISSLPTSYVIGLQDAAGFSPGDSVICADSNFNGIISSLWASGIVVVGTSNDSQIFVGERIASPNKSTTVTSAYGSEPQPSYVWDEPLISPIRGYPRSGSSAAGRLFLCDFPQVPDLIAASSARGITDFESGVEDDDAILRQVGDNTPRFRHVVNAGDLILLSDRGLYYVSLRDGNIISPTSFNAVLFDRRSANEVRPVTIGSGVVFVEAAGNSIAACVEIGNVYLKWSVQGISTYADHLIRQPRFLCGTSEFSTDNEKYLMVVNDDGTIAAISWTEAFSLENIGFTLWETQGAYLCAAPAFGGYWAITERLVDGTLRRLTERFVRGAVLDCSQPVTVAHLLEANGDTLQVNGDTLLVDTPSLQAFAGQSLRVTHAGFDYGDATVGSGGALVGVEADGDAVAGFNFTASVMPWPAEHIDTPRAGMLQARLIRGAVSVLNTNEITIRANNSTRKALGYAFGDDLSEPPPARTQVYKFSVIGRRDHPEIEIRKDVPGRFELLAITQEVQA